MGSYDRPPRRRRKRVAPGVFQRDPGDPRGPGRPCEFGDWLKLLPEAIEALEARTGERLVVELPAVPRPDQAALLRTLGVEWTVTE